ncbi:DNA processing protein [Pseudarcicella hirudinis]|uniref:DNA processing protein n=1 Tax=Pseudarcicella hirudinis TaxID=1079859 RepID=A0A1I5RDA3_9BACT|nr:DNA-processing protein DprA [Pseudarcicella hirudinis]SFP56301.1 DNA processing protein [Pseudarcicella hirudinis]
METTEKKLHQIALTLIPKIGDVLVRQLISYCGSAEQVFKTPKGKLLKIPHIGNILADSLQNKSVLEKARKILQQADDSGTKLLFYTDPEYPARLKQLYDAPVLLFYRGNADLNKQRVVAVVGTRQSTEYGKQITEQLVSELKQYNALIVSGLAYGIDIVAHRASLRSQVETIGVMASGIDIVYPKSHKSVAKQMINYGGLLTEHTFGTEPDQRFFPQRNRIIAGMSDAVIVVEAASKGGALITAEFANNYHREVFAVPGPLGKPSSEGCNRLIRNNKAQIFTGTSDFIDSMNWNFSAPDQHIELHPKELDLTGFTENESQVIFLLRQHREMQIDEMAWKTQIYMGQLASLLLNLEFQGIVRSLPGKKYSLVYL